MDRRKFLVRLSGILAALPLVPSIRLPRKVQKSPLLAAPYQPKLSVRAGDDLKIGQTVYFAHPRGVILAVPSGELDNWRKVARVYKNMGDTTLVELI